MIGYIVCFVVNKPKQCCSVSLSVSLSQFEANSSVRRSQVRVCEEETHHTSRGVQGAEVSLKFDNHQLGIWFITTSTKQFPDYYIVFSVYRVNCECHTDLSNFIDNHFAVLLCAFHCVNILHFACVCPVLFACFVLCWCFVSVCFALCVCVCRTWWSFLQRASS